MIAVQELKDGRNVSSLDKNNYKLDWQAEFFSKYYGMVWYGLIMYFCDSNHEITRSSKRKYNNIKDH